MTERRQHVNTLADADAHIESLIKQAIDLAKRVRTLEKMIDTKDTPLWKRIWFRIDGWSPWYRVDQQRRPRPWHRP